MVCDRVITYHRAGERVAADTLLPPVRASASAAASKRATETVCCGRVCVAAPRPSRQVVRLKSAQRHNQIETAPAVVGSSGDTPVPSRAVVAARSSESCSAVLVVAFAVRAFVKKATDVALARPKSLSVLVARSPFARSRRTFGVAVTSSVRRSVATAVRILARPVKRAISLVVVAASRGVVGARCASERFSAGLVAVVVGSVRVYPSHLVLVGAFGVGVGL